MTTIQEATLVSPDITGTDDEVVAALNYWSELASHLRLMSKAVISFENKAAIIMALKAEIEQIEMDLHNVTATVAQQNKDAIPSMVQDPADLANKVDPTEVDLSQPEPEASVKPFEQPTIDRLRKVAGMDPTFPSRPNDYKIAPTAATPIKTFSKDAIDKLRKMAGVGK